MTKELIEKEFGTGEIERQLPGYGRIVNHWRVVQRGPTWDRAEEEPTTEVDAFARAIGVPPRLRKLDSTYSFDVMEDDGGARAVRILQVDSQGISHHIKVPVGFLPEFLVWLDLSVKL